VSISAPNSPEQSSVPSWSRYVAIGDSFTEGLNDVDPHNPFQYRGWADVLAASLAKRQREAGVQPLEYANLAVRGRLIDNIVGEQLEQALDLKPDLVSIIAGGNDILRPAVNIDLISLRLERAIIKLRQAGIDVLMGTGMDARHSPIVNKTRGRTALYNANIWSIARRHGAYVLDLWGMRPLLDWRMWSEDRIHLTTEGHRRVTQAALVGLGLTPDDLRWAQPLEELPPAAQIDKMRDDAAWLKNHVFPWATRRLRRTSSGANKEAKRPEPEQL